ncbi:MAG: hypothetical protein AAGA29_02390 [Planctomycetota bacterium]
MNQRPPRTHDDPGSMHGTLLAVALLMIALLLAPKANADNGANPLERTGQGGNNQAQQAGPPEWVVPGARFTQYGATAQGSREVKPERVSGAAGTSFVQYDVVAVTEVGVVIESRIYMETGPNTPAQLTNTNTALVDHATGGGLWMRPADIAAEQPTTDENAATKIEKGPYEIDGDTYDAIYYTTRQGNTTQRRVYDQRTGIQLYQSDLTEDTQNRSHAYTEYVGYRVAQLPWIGTEFTQQIQGLTKLTYRGELVSVMPPAPDLNMPDLRYGFEAEIAFQAVTPHLIGVNIAFELDMPQGPDQTNEKRDLVAPGQRLGLYIHPDVLSRLENGQVLDEDPAIGYRIVVTDVYQVQGVTLVEITEQGRGNCYYNKATYDASVGLQVASEWTQPAMSQRIESQLDAVE